MEKKKNLLGNLRFKGKFPNLKKLGKKAPPKQGKKLVYRRSISVPDLHLPTTESDSSDAIYFGVYPGQSDTDSVASSTVTDGPIFMDKPLDAVQEVRLRVPKGNEMGDLEGTASESKEPLYAQNEKCQNKGNVRRYTFDPILAPLVVNNNLQCQSPTPSFERQLSCDRIQNSEDRFSASELPGTVAAAIARAHSMGEQARDMEKKSVQFEQKESPSEKGTPLALKRKSPKPLVLDTLGTHVESADQTSLDSPCDEERVNMAWNTDSEEQEREISEFCMDEDMLLGAQHEDALEDHPELSSEANDFDENKQELPEGSNRTEPEPQTPAPFAFQRYLLNINLRQGRNLVIRDKRSGTSDPYVKFKLEGKQFYKSKVVYKNLNPRWNESFSHPLRDKDHIIEVRVYDKNRTSDDFMGSSSFDLKHFELYKNYEIELPLDDPKSKEDDMGVIIVDVCLMFRDATIKRSPRWPPKKNKQNQAAQGQRLTEGSKSQSRNRMWTGELGIILVEGLDMPQYGHGDIYVRFRLGDQKYKSKNLCIQPNPQWREQFDFNQYEDNQEPLLVEVFAKRGRKAEESWGMLEIDPSRLPLNERQLYTQMLDPGKGRLVFLVTLRSCWGVSISDMEEAPLEKPEERENIENRFGLKNSHKCAGEVGFLQVKVVRANDLASTDLNGKSNPFCVIEVGNSRLQTHTLYKTVNPEWNKALAFPIKDIHEVIEITVLDENGDNFLGKVAVPLLTVKNGQQICLFLKKEDLEKTHKGTITLELDVIYNKVRAGVKTFKPKESKLTEENAKFSKKVLAQNIFRVRKISTAVLYTLQYIKSCFQWESTQRSLIAFLIFLVTVWHWELFMLPLFLLVLIGWNYIQLNTGKANANQDLVNVSMGDDEEDDEKDATRKGLMDKIHMVQEVVLVVQNVLEEIANIGERTKNIFNWSVPFVSCLACLVLFVAAGLLYFVPLRYIVLIWGVNKFTKRLRNPYTIDNNEILDFLKRVPSDVQKVQYSALSAPTSTSQQRKKK